MGVKVQDTGTYITSQKQKEGRIPLHLIELILACRWASIVPSAINSPSVDVSSCCPSSADVNQVS